MYIFGALKLPTHEEMIAAKAHLKQVDNAQELVLEAMFDDLRSNYDCLINKKNLDKNQINNLKLNRAIFNCFQWN